MKRPLLALAAIAIIAFVVWRFLSPGQNPSAPTSPAAGSDQSKIPQAPGLPNEVNPKSKTSEPAPDVSDLAKDLNSPASDIHADLRLVNGCIATFRSNFPRDGNPVGSNAEITAALTGRNPLRLALIPPSHPAINRAGELCDRWGTPFYFHAESGTRMTIRSAGPDKKLHTDDDESLSP